MHVLLLSKYAWPGDVELMLGLVVQLLGTFGAKARVCAAGVIPAGGWR